MIGRSIGIQAGGLEDVIVALKKGLPVSTLNKLCKNMGVPESRLATTVNIPQRTLTRRKAEGRFRPDESERVLRLARLFERALDVMGSEQTAQQWFQSPVKGLGGKRLCNSPIRNPELRKLRRCSIESKTGCFIDPRLAHRQRPQRGRCFFRRRLAAQRRALEQPRESSRLFGRLTGIGNP